MLYRSMFLLTQDELSDILKKLDPKSLAAFSATSRTAAAAATKELNRIRGFVDPLISKGVTIKQLLADDCVHIEGKDFSDKDMVALGTILGLRQEPFTHLFLNENHISSEGMVGFFGAIGRRALQNLTDLNLDNNQIGVSGESALCSESMASLKILSLEGNQIGADMTAFVDFVGKRASLEELWLGNNEINDASMIKFAATVESNAAFENLKSLDLGSNPFDNEGVDALTKALNNEAIGSLETLFIRNRKFDDFAKERLETACTVRGITCIAE